MNPFEKQTHTRREKEKARVLRKSLWWRQQLGQGRCYHCEEQFAREELTMDHLIPIARGGCTTKKNVVVACKRCNSQKKNLTVAEIRLSEI